MSSKQPDDSKSEISPVLFLTLEGNPMSFYLRPGSAKQRLQPLVSAGGGLVCKVQTPEAILLIDPEEGGSVPETTAHLYVSTKYIDDCIEKDEQLNLDDYRLEPSNSNRGVSGGRTAYTPEEDAAILNYVSKMKKSTGGNRLWQQMEKQRVTSHSWQSMKSHYKFLVSHKQSKSEALETDDTMAAEEEKRVEAQHAHVDNPRSERVEAQASTSPQAEVQSHDPGKEDQPAENTQAETAEAASPNSPDPEDGCQQTNDQPRPAAGTEAETDQSQPNVSPQAGNMLDNSQLFLSETLHDISPLKQTDTPVRRLRRSLRIQRDVDEEEPYSKKLRSAAGELLSSTPRSSKKSLQKDAMAEESSPSKRDNGVVRENEADGEQVSASETNKQEAGEDSHSAPPSAKKKKEKRQLGILELATKEFEDESESGDDFPHAQNQPESNASAARPLLPSDTDLQQQQQQQQQVQEAQASTSNHVPEPRPAAASEPFPAASKAHLFIFESESQEEDSQSVQGDGAAAGPAAGPADLQPVGSKDAALSLTQVQLEEDKKQIQELMNQAEKDLVCVTKALLQTSGDFSAALELLLNPSSVLGPVWSHSDDSLLLSADSRVRQQLQNKYGEAAVSKRILFLEERK